MQARRRPAALHLARPCGARRQAAAQAPHPSLPETHHPTDCFACERPGCRRGTCGSGAARLVRPSARSLLLGCRQRQQGLPHGPESILGAVPLFAFALPQANAACGPRAPCPRKAPRSVVAFCQSVVRGGAVGAQAACPAADAPAPAQHPAHPGLALAIVFPPSHVIRLCAFTPPVSLCSCASPSCALPFRAALWRVSPQLPEPAVARQDTVGQGRPPADLIPFHARWVVHHLFASNRTYCNSRPCSPWRQFEMEAVVACGAASLACGACEREAPAAELQQVLRARDALPSCRL